MIYTYAKSHIGYSHIKNNKFLQDHTSNYKENNRYIITCCDGHGGNTYIRSHLGSRFGSLSVLNTLTLVDPILFKKYEDEDLINKIKLDILCNWNNMVDKHLKEFPFRDNELKELEQKSLDELSKNPFSAYGTTLTGAMLYKNKLVIVSIGDSNCFLLKNGHIENAFNDEDEPVGNITYSMCQEDAYNYLKIRIVDFKDYDGILLCSDGLSSPYQSYYNFEKSFVKPTISNFIKNRRFGNIDLSIEKIATKLGIGDDVSLSFIISDKISVSNYK